MEQKTPREALMAEAKAGLMAGKRGLIMGVANDHSIAWGIAQMMASQGAELAFTYQGDAQAKRLKPLAASIGSEFILPGDVEKDAELDAVFAQIKQEWGTLDFLVHAIAFSDAKELKGRYVDTTRANFLKTLDISCYSFTAVARRACPLMNKGGAMVTLTYLGAQRVMPNYNVMGVAKAALEASVRYLAADLGQNNIRVNAISAGPMKTLAASGIGDFRYILKWNEYNAPLRRHHRRGRRQRAVSVVGPVARRYRRGASRRFRVSRRRHEAPGCAGYFAGEGLALPSS